MKISKIRKSRFLKIFNFWRKKLFFFKISKISKKIFFYSFSNCSKKFSKKPISIIFGVLKTYVPDTFIFSLFVTTRQDWGTLWHPYICWFFGKSGFGGLYLATCWMTANFSSTQIPLDKWIGWDQIWEQNCCMSAHFQKICLTILSCLIWSIKTFPAIWSMLIEPFFHNRDFSGASRSQDFIFSTPGPPMARQLDRRFRRFLHLNLHPPGQKPLKTPEGVPESL